MAWWRWAATALCLVVVVAAQTQWLAPPSPRLSVSTASPAIAFCSCAAKPCSSWRLGHDRASSSLSGAEMPSSRFIAEAYPCCGWRGARNICCCRSHWTRSSGRLPLCGCGRSSNGSWSRWITWSRYWLACRNLFCWIGCCRFLPVMCLMGRDVACRSRAWLDSTGLRAARVRAPALPLVICATGVGTVIVQLNLGIDPARIAHTRKIFWRIDIQAQFRCL